MESLIKLATDMQWPFTFAMIGLGVSVSLPFIVRGVSRQETERQRIRARSDVEKAQIAVSVKNGAITHGGE